jgi:hypothetical protein
MSDNNGWPGKPGVPLNPEQDSEGYVWRVDGVMDIHKWAAKKQRYEDQRGFWVTPDQLIADGDEYFGRIVTPAEVEARIATARKDALEEAARVVKEIWEKSMQPLPDDEYIYPDATDLPTGLTYEAAIRALAKGEGDD